MKQILLMIVAVVMVGCHTIDDSARDFSKIRIGMSRDEVIAAKGNPFETAAKDGTEYLMWAMGATELGVYYVHEDEKYYVRLVDGKVDSYGKVGDFDSTKDPALRIIKQRK
jgi:hypothetical protein